MIMIDAQVHIWAARHTAAGVLGNGSHPSTLPVPTGLDPVYRVLYAGAKTSSDASPSALLAAAAPWLTRTAKAASRCSTGMT